MGFADRFKSLGKAVDKKESDIKSRGLRPGDAARSTFKLKYRS